MMGVIIWNGCALQSLPYGPYDINGVVGSGRSLWEKLGAVVVVKKGYGTTECYIMLMDDIIMRKRRMCRLEILGQRTC